MAAAPLTDGEWHRLHPLTPLLKGGIFLVVILGYVLNNLRDQIVEVFIPGEGGPQEDGDPVRYVYEHGVVGWVLLGRGRAPPGAAGALHPVLADARVPRDGRDRRGPLRRRVPHAPQGPARPHPGHQHLPPARPAAVRHGEARDRAGRQRRERPARLPRGQGGGRPAAAHPRAGLGREGPGAVPVRRGRRRGLPGRVDDFLAPELDPEAVHATRSSGCTPVASSRRCCSPARRSSSCCSSSRSS